MVEVAPQEFVYVCGAYEHRYFTNFDIEGQLEVVRLLESFRPDVVHMHHFLGFGIEFVALLRRRLPSTRLVFTFHEFLSICANKGHLRRSYDGGICEQAHPVRCQQCFPGERLEFFAHRKSFFTSMFALFDELTTVSEFARATLARNLPLPRPIRVVPNGPVANPATRVARVGLGPEERCVVGFIGQVHEAKGAAQLVTALSRLIEERTVSARNVELRIYGNSVDAPHSQQLAALAANSGTRASQLKLTLCGPYAPGNLKALFTEIDVVVVPSLWPESYCLTADEAVLAGKVLVCSNFPAVLERMRPTKTTLFFEQGSTQDLARALRLALQAASSDEWEDPFTVPTTTQQALFDTYCNQLYRDGSLERAG
jgi:glycosyltransferase involved in cell wall biosynthesis